jgi:periplasmic copper chaperone A
MTMGRFAAAMAALVMTAGLSAQGAVTASAGWVMEPAAGATSTSAFAVIENPTMYEVYVVGVTSTVAATAEVAEGPAHAPKAVRELPVPAYGSAELKPGGVHILLKDLKKPLKAGDSVELTLTTDGGAVIKMTAPVKKG